MVEIAEFSEPERPLNEITSVTFQMQDPLGDVRGSAGYLAAYGILEPMQSEAMPNQTLEVEPRLVYGEDATTLVTTPNDGELVSIINLRDLPSAAGANKALATRLLNHVFYVASLAHHPAWSEYSALSGCIPLTPLADKIEYRHYLGILAAKANTLSRILQTKYVEQPRRTSINFFEEYCKTLYTDSEPQEYQDSPYYLQHLDRG